MRLNKVQLTALLQWCGPKSYSQVWMQPGCVWAGSDSAVVCVADRPPDESCAIDGSLGRAVDSGTLRAAMGLLSGTQRLTVGCGLVSIVDRPGAEVVDLSSWPSDVRGAMPQLDHGVPWGYLRHPATGVWPQPELGAWALRLLAMLPRAAGASVRNTRIPVRMIATGDHGAYVATVSCGGIYALCALATGVRKHAVVVRG